MRARDLTGLTFNRLTVIGQAPKREGEPASRYWIVQCSCGSEPKEVSGPALTSGRTHSCGCWAKEYRRIAGEEMSAHFAAQRAQKGAGR